MLYKGVPFGTNASRSEQINAALDVIQTLSDFYIVVVESIGGFMSEARRISKAPDEKERLRAAELLGKRYGMFTDNIKVAGVVPVVISGENELED